MRLSTIKKKIIKPGQATIIDENGITFCFKLILEDLFGPIWSFVA